MKLCKELGWLVLTALALTLTVPRVTEASSRICDGPAECCPTVLIETLHEHRTVAIGVVLVGLYNVNERSSTWDADYYLYESWTPAPGFTPQTEVVNEVTRQSEQYDETELRSGRCVRSRRLHSTLHNRFNLRTFPFDHQELALEFSDAEYDVDSVSYPDRPLPTGLDSGAREQLSAWSIEGSLTYVHAPRRFEWEDGAPHYDYATFQLPVQRHVTYHLTRFFLPLLVILLVAFTVFWIDPSDLNSQVGVGVTCLLAAIAFQYAEGGSLPEVAYLTLADRTYAVSYSAIALAIVESIVVNSLARAGKAEQALRVDRRCRVAFPVAVMVAVFASVLRSIFLSRS